MGLKASQGNGMLENEPVHEQPTETRKYLHWKRRKCLTPEAFRRNIL
jgi:hypothetical protein